ncbi:hypothetical protein D3C77_402500 [compost metagenome]
MNISNMQKYVKPFSEEKGFDDNTIQTRTLFNILDLANQLEIDMEEACQKKM